MLSICARTVCMLRLIPITGLAMEIKYGLFPKEINLSSSCILTGHRNMNLTIPRKIQANNVNLVFIQFYSMLSPFKCLQENNATA